MPDFVALTDAETNAKAFTRQALWKKLKDNFDNLNSRNLKIESSIRLFDHFNWRPPGANKSFDTIHVGSSDQTIAHNNYGGRDWMFLPSAGANAGDNSVNADKPHYSVARMRVAVGEWGQHLSKMQLRFDGVTKPIIYECRLKLSVDAILWCGMRAVPAGAFIEDLTATDRQGIWLERVDATNWRFVSFDTARTNGTGFAKPTPGNWFTVKIEFTDTPSNRALCSVDGVLKETLTTQLPTAVGLNLANLVKYNGATADMDNDRAEYSAVGIADAP